MLRRVIFSTAAMCAVIAASPAAAAVTINPSGSATITSGTAVGSNFTVNFNGIENGVIAGLTSSLKLTFAGTSGNNYLFDYVLPNSSTSPTTSSAVTAFGFNIDPNALLASSSVNGTYGVVSSGQVSQGYNLELCFKIGQNNNCAGSPGNQGVDMGGSGSGTITLGFSSLPSSLTLSDYMVRYQAVNGSGSAIGLQVPAVPEPATWAMMLLGFAGIGMSVRGSRKSSVVRLAA